MGVMAILSWTMTLAAISCHPQERGLLGPRSGAATDKADHRRIERRMSGCAEPTKSDSTELNTAEAIGQKRQRGMPQTAAADPNGNPECLRLPAVTDVWPQSTTREALASKGALATGCSTSPATASQKIPVPVLAPVKRSWLRPPAPNWCYGGWQRQGCDAATRSQADCRRSEPSKGGCSRHSTSVRTEPSTAEAIGQKRQRGMPQTAAADPNGNPECLGLPPVTTDEPPAITLERPQPTKECWLLAASQNRPKPTHSANSNPRFPLSVPIGSLSWAWFTTYSNVAFPITTLPVLASPVQHQFPREHSSATVESLSLPTPLSVSKGAFSTSSLIQHQSSSSMRAFPSHSSASPHPCSSSITGPALFHKGATDPSFQSMLTPTNCSTLLYKGAIPPLHQCHVSHCCTREPLLPSCNVLQGSLSPFVLTLFFVCLPLCFRNIFRTQSPAPASIQCVLLQSRQAATSQQGSATIMDFGKIAGLLWLKH